MKKGKTFTIYVITSLLIFALTLLISYFAFATKGFIPSGDVSKEAWLSFWGGFLTFYGTLFLGFVSLWQNKKLSDEAERANTISEKLAGLSNQANKLNADLVNINNSCNIILREVTNSNDAIELTNENKTCYEINEYFHLYLNIINYGEAVLKRVLIKFSDEECFSSHINIVKNENKNVAIPFPKNLSYDRWIDVSFVGCSDLFTYGCFKLVKVGNQPRMQDYKFYGLNKDVVYLS